MPLCALSQTAKGELSLFEMGNSGTLLKSFYRTGAAIPARVLAPPVPSVHRHSCRRPGLVACATSEPSHYAVKRVITSTALRAECEDQSRRLDKASYSRPAARSIEASNQSANRAWKFRYGSNRWLSVCAAKRGRRLQAEYRWKAEAARKEENPPAKIKLGLSEGNVVATIPSLTKYS